MKKKKSKRKAENSEWTYRLEIEFPDLLGHHYQPLVDAGETKVFAMATKMKMAGIGGRLYRYDGPPGGTLVEVWAGSERLARAEKLQEQHLKGL